MSFTIIIYDLIDNKYVYFYKYRNIPTFSKHF